MVAANGDMRASEEEEEEEEPAAAVNWHYGSADVRRNALGARSHSERGLPSTAGGLSRVALPGPQSGAPGAGNRRAGQDGCVDPLVRLLLEPRRLASGAVFGIVIGMPSILLLGSEAPTWRTTSGWRSWLC